MSGTAGWEPGTEAEAALYDALIAGDQERYFRALGRIELLLPVSADAVAGRTPMGWATWTANDQTHLLAFTSNESMRTCLAEHVGGARRMSLRDLAGVWPNNDWWLAINPGLPIEGYLPAWFVAQLARGDSRLPRQADSMPRDRLERVQALERAKAARAAAPPREREPLSGTIVSAGETRALPPSHTPSFAPLGTPAPRPPTPLPAPPPPPRQAPAASPPSPPRRASSVPPQESPLREPPSPAKPTQASPAAETPAVPAPPVPEAAPAGSRRPDRPRHAEPEPDFVPANSVEEQLYEAAEAGNTDSFLSTLLLATVLIPKATGTDNGAWRPQPIDGEPHLVCYTSTQHFDQQLETVSVRFIKLISEWPDPNWSFAVNPGTPVGATLPGGQLLALANWAAEVGLGGDDDEREQSTSQVNGTSVAGRSSPEVTVLQKAVAPSQVGYYLDRGYDRVTGFVHRAHEVGHLKDAREMHKALGLDWEGSPFTDDDKEIYLLRWSAYRPNLYRIPYGGQNEAAMKAMEGWVIERAPFRGNGFAPGGSKEIMAEFKVDSVRLPHGSRLLRLREGVEEIVAVFDADLVRWLRIEVPPPGGTVGAA